MEVPEFNKLINVVTEESFALRKVKRKEFTTLIFVRSSLISFWRTLFPFFCFEKQSFTFSKIQNTTKQPTTPWGVGISKRMELITYVKGKFVYARTNESGDAEE